MNRKQTTMWWMAAVRGAGALVMGAVALLVPDIPLAGMVMLFAAFAGASGLAYCMGSMRRRAAGTRSGGVLMAGMFSLCAGVLALLRPAPTALVLLLLIATHALAIGLLDAVEVRYQGRRQPGMRLPGLATLLSIGFALAVFAAPAQAAQATGMAVGLYGVINGTLWLGQALALRRRAASLRHAAMVRPGYGDGNAGGLRRRSI